METTIAELKKVALNDAHFALGAKMIPFAGFLMPVRYSSDLEEHNTVRNGVGVFDVSHMGEFMIKGTRSLDFIQNITTNDASKLTDGKVQYSCFTNEQAGIVDDLLVYKQADEEYMLVVNAGNIEKDWNWVNSHKIDGVELLNLSEEFSLFAVQGPKAIAVLQKLTSVNLADIKYYTFVKGELAGIKDIIISATGYTGAGGFELYIKNADALTVWNKIFEAGQEEGIKPIGLGARDTLRLEMGYCLYGNDIDDTTTPLEAGLGWITKLNKKFIASDQLVKQKEQGVKRKLVGFEMVERGIPRSHYEILNAENKQIGFVTSGTQSPSLGIGIGMGYVSSECSNAGSEVYIKIREKALKAKIVTLPFYKA